MMLLKILVCPPKSPLIRLYHRVVNFLDWLKNLWPKFYLFWLFWSILNEKGSIFLVHFMCFFCVCVWFFFFFFLLNENESGFSEDGLEDSRVWDTSSSYQLF